MTSILLLSQMRSDHGNVRDDYSVHVCTDVRIFYE